MGYNNAAYQNQLLTLHGITIYMHPMPFIIICKKKFHLAALMVVQTIVIRSFTWVMLRLMTSAWRLSLYR
jgi:hypothetical protein